MLTFDRRRAANGGDVPVEQQAHGALSALERLRERLGVPVGLYGFSQGAWAAAAAARDPRVAWLAVIGCPGQLATYVLGVTLAQRHEPHLRRDVAPARLGELRDGSTRQVAARLACVGEDPVEVAATHPAALRRLASLSLTHRCAPSFPCRSARTSAALVTHKRRYEPQACEAPGAASRQAGFW